MTEQYQLDQFIAVILLRQLSSIHSLQERQAHTQKIMFSTEALKNLAIAIDSLKQAGISHLDNEQVEKFVNSLQLESLLEN